MEAEVGGSHSQGPGAGARPGAAGPARPGGSPPRQPEVEGPADVGPAPPTGAGAQAQSPFRNRKGGSPAPSAGGGAARAPPAGLAGGEGFAVQAAGAEERGSGAGGAPPAPGAQGGGVRGGRGGGAGGGQPGPAPGPRPLKRRSDAPQPEGGAKRRAAPLLSGEKFYVVHRVPCCTCGECAALKALILGNGGTVLKKASIDKKMGDIIKAVNQDPKLHIVAFPSVIRQELESRLSIRTLAQAAVLKEIVKLELWLRDCVSANAVLPAGKEEHVWRDPPKPSAQEKAGECRLTTPSAHAGRSADGAEVTDDQAAYPAGMPPRNRKDLDIWRGGVPSEPFQGKPNLGVLENVDSMSDAELSDGQEPFPKESKETPDFRNVLPEKWVDKRAGSFLCAKAKGQGVEIPATPKVAGANELIVRSFNELAVIYKAAGVREDAWRIKVYKQAAGTIGRWRQGITCENLEAQLQEMQEMACIGPKTRERIRELVETGELRMLESFKKEPRIRALREFATVHGIGPSTARQLWDAGARAVAELRTLVEQGKTEFVGTGGAVKLSAVIVTGLKYYDDMQLKMDRSEIESIGNFFSKVAAGACGPLLVVEIMGSFRRGKPQSHDVDILVTYRNDTPVAGTLHQILAALREATELVDLALPTAQSEHGTEIYLGMLRPPVGVGNHKVMRRFDVRVYERRNYPYALLHMTGSDHFNRSLRLFAKKKGLKLSDNGLRQVARERGTGPALRVYPVGENTHNVGENKCKTEKDVFEVLKLDYVPPEERHSGVWVVTDNSVRLGEATADGSGGVVGDNDSIYETTDDESDVKAATDEAPAQPRTNGTDEDEGEETDRED